MVFNFFSRYQRYQKYTNFCTTLHDLIQTGIPLEKTLEILIQEEKSNLSKKNIQCIKDALNNGNAFIKALGHYLDFHEIFRINRLQQPPNLPAFILRCGSYYQQKMKMFEWLSKKLTYPIFLFVTLTAIFSIYYLMIEPALYMDTSSLLTSDITVTVYRPILICFSLAYGSLLVTPFLPLFFEWLKQIYLWLCISEILWLFSCWIDGGCSLKSTLESLQFSEDSYLKKQYHHFMTCFLTGSSFSESFSSAFPLSELNGTLLKQAERNGQLGKNLLLISENSLTAYQRTISTIIYWGQGLLLLLISILIGFFAYLIYLPLWTGFELL